jgi:hypothetical protein
MKIDPSSVAGIELTAPGTPAFDNALESLLGRPPDDVLKPALPFSVIVRNDDSRAVALLGIRFDMLGREARPYSVVHYADTLRHPEKADLAPGGMRFVCAEPLYTDLVLRRAHEVDLRGRMNLDNLRTVLRIRASVDCVAFDDGQFAGPDSLGAFDRFAKERDGETALLHELLTAGSTPAAVLRKALEIPPSEARDRALIARKALARRLQEILQTGGIEEMYLNAHNHRVKIALWRPK